MASDWADQHLTSLVTGATPDEEDGGVVCFSESRQFMFKFMSLHLADAFIQSDLHLP